MCNKHAKTEKCSDHVRTYSTGYKLQKGQK